MSGLEGQNEPHDGATDVFAAACILIASGLCFSGSLICMAAGPNWVAESIVLWVVVALLLLAHGLRSVEVKARR